MKDFSQRIVLGSTELIVPKMGFGSDAGIPAKALEQAFDKGFNYFYWGSRRRKGMKEAIRHLAPRNRDKMVIALQTYDYTGLALDKTLVLGLRKLKIEQADIFILGMRNGPVPGRILDKALSLQERGLVRYLCVSAHNRSAYRQHLQRNIFDLIMVRYNAAHRGAEKEVLPLLPEENRPGVICYNSTRWGHLFDPQWMPAGEKTPSPNDLYRYVLSHDSIDMVLSAPATQAQLEENVKALEEGPTSVEEKAWLERVGDHVHGLNPSTNFDFIFQTRRPGK